MKTMRRAAGVAVVAAATALLANAQSGPPVRRAQPVDSPPVARALPADDATPTPARKPRSSPTPNDNNSPDHEASQSDGDTSPAEAQGQDKRQLDYANALFGRKMYDLAVPEFEKFLSDFPNAQGRASAYFFLGESNRALSKQAQARNNLQAVLDKYGDSEYAGPAAYALAEIAFNQKDYSGALPFFHRAASKAKEGAVVLSARYFEARCLETLNRKDEAADLYLQVIDAKNPNQFREDSRSAAAAIFVAKGRKADALRQYEALANEASKPALKAEDATRAAILATELAQPDRGKIDKGMAEKAQSLLQKARSLPEAGKWHGIAQVYLLRFYGQTGQFAQLITEHKKIQDQLPDDAKPEMLLLVGNAQRQLGHAKEAEEVYRQVIAKYPTREEAKDAQYERLINIYNSDPKAVIAEVDAFLQLGPGGERADQAKLLKAEALYKEQQFQPAAVVYEELRASQLAPKLRAEAAYKLGWCYVQAKDLPRTIEAFSYFLKGFPDNPQVPSAVTQRALAYHQSKNTDAAISDLTFLLTNFPNAREREAALQQRAMLLNEQGNARLMTETFQQLLKEFPKSPAAAQANYYIGKAAFEAKDFKRAIATLDTARKLNKDQYYNLATVRIISSLFYLKDRPATTSEVNAFIAANPKGGVPADILEWLGMDYYNEKNYPFAEKYLGVLGQTAAEKAKPDFWFYLGETETRLKKYPEADSAYTHYLQTATDPAGKAKALLALGATKISAHKPDDAQRIAEELTKLQPEGRLSAEARLLAGDVQMERQRFDDAGKAFMSVALLYDDPAITPRALQKAAAAFQRAGKQEEAERAARQLRERYPNFATS